MGEPPAKGSAILLHDATGKPDKIKSISNNTLAKRRLERQSGIAFSIPEFTTPNAVRPAVTPYIGMARTLLIML
jgi:hypothetical protein